MAGHAQLSRIGPVRRAPRAPDESLQPGAEGRLQARRRRPPVAPRALDGQEHSLVPRPRELREDGVLAAELEVHRAHADLRLARDVRHGGLEGPVVAEEPAGGLQNRLPARSFAHVHSTGGNARWSDRTPVREPATQRAGHQGLTLS